MFVVRHADPRKRIKCRKFEERHLLRYVPYYKPAFLLLLFSTSLCASSIWIDVPFVKQKQNGCGAATISMVMQYWNKESGAPRFIEDPETIDRALYSVDAKGIYASRMKQYFDEHGFKTFVFTGTWQDLEHHLAKGRPLIAALSAGEGSDRFHYVVVAGIDSQNNLALLNDPSEKKLLKIHRSDFEKQWKLTNCWALLAVPENAN